MNTLHTNYERRVLDRTLGRNKYLNQHSFLSSQREWFFVVDDFRALYRFKTPGELATIMAYDTFFDSYQIGGDRGEHDYYFMLECTDEGFYKSEFWPEDNRWKGWDPKSGYTPYNFIKRTEELLNHAITCVASALNWVIDQVQGFTCKPSGTDDTSTDELYLSFAADLLFDGFFKVMTFIGVYASVYAIPLTSASKYLKGG
jgi:hypothetical protein